MMNQEFLGMAGHVEMEHLTRTVSDHASLLLSCGGKQPHIRKPFKLLKFWEEEADFKEVVKKVRLFRRVQISLSLLSRK